MKKLTISAFTALVILVLFKCNPNPGGDNFTVILNSISPDTKVSHMPSFTLTATGSNFDANSTIVFNGTEKQTTFVSAAELTCQIDPEDTVPGSSGNHEPMVSGIMQDETVPVLVRSPLPGGGDSNILYFTIRDNHTFNESVKIFDDSSSSDSPDIAVDSAGNINVVWRNLVYNPGTPHIIEIFFSRSIDDGLTWSQPVNISNPSVYSTSPAIALDSVGNIDVVWADRTPGNDDIYFSRSTDGGETWSQAVNISNTPGVSQSPVIAVDYAGNIDVTWFDETSRNYDIYFSRSTDDGLTWNQVVNISNHLEYSSFPNIAVDSAGNIYVAWSAITPYDFDIYFSRASVDSLSWSQPVNISHTFDTSYYPAIAVDSAGNPNVVWYDMIYILPFPNILKGLGTLNQQQIEYYKAVVDCMNREKGVIPCKLDKVFVRESKNYLPCAVGLHFWDHWKLSSPFNNYSQQKKIQTSDMAKILTLIRLAKPSSKNFTTLTLNSLTK